MSDGPEWPTWGEAIRVGHALAALGLAFGVMMAALGAVLYPFTTGFGREFVMWGLSRVSLLIGLSVFGALLTHLGKWLLETPAPIAELRGESQALDADDLEEQPEAVET